MVGKFSVAIAPVYRVKKKYFSVRINLNVESIQWHYRKLSHNFAVLHILFHKVEPVIVIITSQEQDPVLF